MLRLKVIMNGPDLIVLIGRIRLIALAATHIILGFNIIPGHLL